MNKEESLALYEQGREAWNAWAETKLADRTALEEAGEWVDGSDPDKWNEATRAWSDEAKADFSNHGYANNVDFSNCIFPGFAVFHGEKFMQNARFDGAKFMGDARFNSAKFTGDAWFFGTEFKGGAWFDQSQFEGYTSFDVARFEGKAGFGAIDVRSAFTLAVSRFGVTPDFIQARFAEAPRLDNLRIEPEPFWPKSREDIKSWFKGDPELAARWRALKRIAIQGHDHERELEYFKGEIKALRSISGVSRLGVFVLSLPYQWFSDFGRSMLLPLLWLIAGIFGFAGLYHARFLSLIGEPLSAIGPPSPLSCLAGPGDPWHSALLLSLHKGLIFLGINSGGKLNQIYACLYGVHAPKNTVPGDLSSGFLPVIPDGIALLSLLQLLFSAVMIFLLLLAVRNHFRIK